MAVTFGPQYGPITAKQVEDCLREAYRRGYDDLVFAGFTIDGAAQAAIQDDPNPRVRCHQAHIRPDVAMGDLLKDTPGSQLFTVFGLPRVKLASVGKDEWMVEMEGVDIYDPVANTVQATDAGKVAAWFLDSDYDGRTFCITQAFFPDASAWEKLARALKSVVDADRFAAFSGTRSLPFAAGKHGRIAVKVIDPRGNEVMRVMRLASETASRRRISRRASELGPKSPRLAAPLPVQPVEKPIFCRPIEEPTKHWVYVDAMRPSGPAAGHLLFQSGAGRRWRPA